MPVDQFVLSRSLQYYKRREVQEAILRHATDREVSPRYGEGFGKRPDVLFNPQDVLEFAKRKCTSFHASEERWSSPLNIKTGASKKELNDLRSGWDLVLDIDAKDWGISRLTAQLFIETLRANGVNCISVKFSGNKGWHIGVPFEAFPKTVIDSHGKDVLVKDLFPDLPRAIAGYLLDYMSRAENGLITIRDDEVLFGKDVPGNSRMRYTFKDLAAIAGKNDILENYCPKCAKSVGVQEEEYVLSCMHCQNRLPQKYNREDTMLFDANSLVCPKCKRIMEFTLISRKSCPHNPAQYERRFKFSDIIQVDTILLASRHLYRMAYSLHEKSGLASVVIDADRVMEFDKSEADPKSISFEKTFLDAANVVPGEAASLCVKALAWAKVKDDAKPVFQREYEDVESAVDEEHFPPCIRAILGGMADGKKRAMFALSNFFIVCGWTPDQIENRLHEWNKDNEKFGEPLREVIIKGHMHNLRQKKDKIMPPNCKSFYQELGVCKPDEFCSRIKNPAQYAIKHVQLGEKPKRRKASDKDAPMDNATVEKKEGE